MCGIIGYAGSSNISKSVLINGLHALEYRGYDSAGIAVLNKNKIQIIKRSLYAHEKHRQDHGADRHPLQGPGLHLRGQRDLRRPGQHLGLRPPGGGAEEQCEEGLVEEVRPGEPL